MELRIETVLMDVDGTMTAVDTGGVPTPTPLDRLAELVAARQGTSLENAKELLLRIDDINEVCLFKNADRIGVSRQELWDVLRKDLERETHIPADTVHFMTAMRGKGVKIHTATTNSRMMTLLKMSLGGLASMDGTPYLAGFYGGDAFGDPEGKFSEGFFPDIMRHGGFDPERTLMLGDTEKWDSLPALKAGIRHAVIIDRRQPEPLLRKDGTLFVSSLELLANMIPSIENNPTID